MGNKRLEKIQEEYFEFCLGLLQKLPVECDEKINLAQMAFSLRNEMRQTLLEHFNDAKGKETKALELEIIKIRIALLEKEI